MAPFSFQAKRRDDDLRPRRSRGESRVSRDRRASGTSQPGERPEAPRAAGPDIVRFPRSSNAIQHQKGHPHGIGPFLLAGRHFHPGTAPNLRSTALPGPTVPFRRRTRGMGEGPAPEGDARRVTRIVIISGVGASRGPLASGRGLLRRRRTSGKGPGAYHPS